MYLAQPYMNLLSEGNKKYRERERRKKKSPNLCENFEMVPLQKEFLLCVVVFGLEANRVADCMVSSQTDSKLKVKWVNEHRLSLKNNWIFGWNIIA